MHETCLIIIEPGTFGLADECSTNICLNKTHDSPGRLIGQGRDAADEASAPELADEAPEAGVEDGVDDGVEHTGGLGEHGGEGEEPGRHGNAERVHHGDEGVGRPHSEETANHDEAHLGKEYIYIYIYIFFFLYLQKHTSG